MRILFTFASVMLACWSTSRAQDIITFKDGESIHGKVISYKDSKLTIRGENGETATGDMNNIKEILFSKNTDNNGTSVVNAVTNNNVEAANTSKISPSPEERQCLEKVLSANYPFTSRELLGKLGNYFVTVRRCADTDGRYDAILSVELCNKFNKKVDWNVSDNSVLGWQIWGCWFTARGINLSSSAGESGFHGFNGKLESSWGMELDRIQRLLRSYQPPVQQEQKN